MTTTSSSRITEKPFRRIVESEVAAELLRGEAEVLCDIAVRAVPLLSVDLEVVLEGLPVIDAHLEPQLSHHRRRGGERLGDGCLEGHVDEAVGASSPHLFEAAQALPEALAPVGPDQHRICLVAVLR